MTDRFEEFFARYADEFDRANYPAIAAMHSYPAVSYNFDGVLIGADSASFQKLLRTYREALASAGLTKSIRLLGVQPLKNGRYRCDIEWLTRNAQGAHVGTKHSRYFLTEPEPGRLLVELTELEREDQDEFAVE